MRFLVNYPVSIVLQLSNNVKQLSNNRILERGTGFEPAHPRVEASVHSLFYVTPAQRAGYDIE
jgi:hypothetical protein